MTVGGGDDTGCFHQYRGQEPFVLVVSRILYQRIRPTTGCLGREHVKVPLLVRAFCPSLRNFRRQIGDQHRTFRVGHLQAIDKTQ